jgi:hypothetical protein
MSSTHRLFLFPTIFLFALALVLPFACGGPVSGTDQQTGAVTSNPSDGCNDPNDGGSPGSGHKVTICHIPPGNPGNAHTISVGAPAVPAHLAHGDHLGPCGPGESHCGDQDGGQQQQDGGNPPDGGQHDAGNPPDGGQPDGGPRP